MEIEIELHLGLEGYHIQGEENEFQAEERVHVQVQPLWLALWQSTEQRGRMENKINSEMAMK